MCCPQSREKDLFPFSLRSDRKQWDQVGGVSHTLQKLHCRKLSSTVLCCAQDTHVHEMSCDCCCRGVSDRPWPDFRVSLNSSVTQTSVTDEEVFTMFSPTVVQWIVGKLRAGWWWATSNRSSLSTVPSAEHIYCSSTECTHKWNNKKINMNWTKKDLWSLWKLITFSLFSP